MKQTLFFAIIICACILGECKAQNGISHSKIYEDIYIHNNDTSFIGTSLKCYRNEIDYLERFDYSSLRDTVYMLEKYTVEGNLFITIWNNKNIHSYTLNSEEKAPHNYQQSSSSDRKSKWTPFQRSLFTKLIMKLIMQWNIPEIKKIEKETRDKHPTNTIFATRLIFDNQKYIIDSFWFKDSFNYE